MINKKVSVIVPFYNARKGLQKCISSIGNQTYRNLQIILINDGSTDDSEKICRIYEEDPRIQVIRKENGGVSSARNRGLKDVTGEFLVFVDADDYIEDEMIERMMDAQREHDADVVFCGYCRHINGKMRPVDLWDNTEIDIMHNAEQLRQLFKKNLLNSPWAKLIKSSLIQSEFDESLSLGEDILFNLAYMERVRIIACANYIGYHYEINTKGGLHLSANERDIIIYKKIYKKTREFFQKFEDQRLLEEADNRFLVNCYSFLESVFRNERNAKKRKAGIELVVEDKEVSDVIGRIPKAAIRKVDMVRRMVRKKKRGALYRYFYLNHNAKRILNKIKGEVP